MTNETKRLQELAPIIKRRQLMNAAIRNFFFRRDFLEVETPVRLPFPAMEDYIDAEPAGQWYLRTSPELHMKRLLAAGYERIFQIGPCFRRAEQGSLHHPEFEMLEWYRLEANYLDILHDCRAMLCEIAQEVADTTVCCTSHGEVDLAADWQLITVDQAFREYAGVPVDKCLAEGNFEEKLVEQVEPHLGFGAPTVLIDYPAGCGGLAKAHDANPAKLERWELYLTGVELANACSELTDVKEQLRRFAKAEQVRCQEGREIYPVDQEFLSALEYFESAAGIALGLDRLLMFLTGTNKISNVIAFPESAP